MRNNIGNMFMNDLQKSLTGEEYDVQSPMRRKEEALKSIAARSPIPSQASQPNELDSVFNVNKGNEFIEGANAVAAGKMKPQDLKGGEVIGLTNDKTSMNDKVQKYEAAPKAEKEKDYSGLASAAEDLGKAFAGPTKAIDVGQYSTFAPEDTMAGIRKQVLENLRMRG